MQQQRTDNLQSRCFTREQRLLESAQFKCVFERSNRVGDRFWTILFRDNDVAFARIGMAVAKKRVKRAVDRNRLKRLIRESFRKEKLPCVDIVVMPRDGTANASTLELRASLSKQWSRIADRCGK